MMYLSSLLVNVGANPDRPRPGRRWLSNIYAVHQRLCMAFPDPQRKERDPVFLQPHNPADLNRDQIHTQRKPGSGFLYRVDSLACGGVMILVLSAIEPDWIYAFQNADMLLAAPPQIKPYNPRFTTGQRLRFKIQANLSKKSKQYEKRVALTWDKDIKPEKAVRDWFMGKANVCLEDSAQPVHAFTLDSFELLKLGWVAGHKPLPANKQCQPGSDNPQYTIQTRKLKFRSALLAGNLEVQDSTAFTKLALGGIGSAKAFGFGLLSLAKAL